MSKYFKLLFVALFAAMSMSLMSCGDDDDEPGGSSGSLTINGVKYRENPAMLWNGSWEEGTFTVSVLDKDNNFCAYSFDFEPEEETVKVGDDFAEMSLTMLVMDVTEASMCTFDYVSGSVVAKSFGKDTMTVEFKNLKMEGETLMGEEASYVFNGTATVTFRK